MGLLERRREHKALDRYHTELEAWTGVRHDLTLMLDELDGEPGSHVDGFAAKQGERIFLDYGGSCLVEPRRAPGHYVGGYSGVSFKIAKGVRYHVGGSRGTFIPGPDVATRIDTGSVTITNQRVVFRGTKQAREWAYPKMLGWSHDASSPMTTIQVSNRQKVSGFTYDPQHAPLVRFRFAWALAWHNDAVDELRSSLKGELVEHDRERPVPPEGVVRDTESAQVAPAKPMALLPAAPGVCPQCGAPPAKPPTPKCTQCGAVRG